jgi:hypothetical protein
MILDAASIPTVATAPTGLEATALLNSELNKLILFTPYLLSGYS